ncbi:MAG: hypothetical protein ACYCTV_08715 [Leptospirales bacterium]
MKILKVQWPIHLVLAIALVCCWNSGPLFGADRAILTPGVGISNGAAGFGGQGKLFFVPNLGIETDFLWTPQICGNCTLSQTTLTENLFYWINPAHFLSLYLSGGAGVGFYDLSRPVSQSAALPVFDVGIGSVFWIGKHVGIEIENRFFFPEGGGLDTNPSSSLNSDRWFLGLSIPL